MKYIIMADGKGSRWGNFTDRPKHLIEIDGESLLGRLVQQLRALDPGCQVVITARDPRYEVEGAVRHVPRNNENEIDRFTSELIEDQVCFLYGDTYYTDRALRTIISANGSGLLFFGNQRRIVSVKIFDGAVMKRHLERIKAENPNGKGWDVYRSYSGLGLKEIGADFVVIEDGTQDFNTPKDYLDFIK